MLLNQRHVDRRGVRAPRVALAPVHAGGVADRGGRSHARRTFATYGASCKPS